MADLNDLQREWDAQPEYSEEKMNEIAELVRTRSGSMRSKLFARDRGETIACVFIIIVFGGYWFFATNAVTKTGIAIMIAACVEIPVLMWLVRRRSRASFASDALKEFLLSEVLMLHRQITLLRHVAWWYLLPLFAGGCVFAIGIGSTFPGGRVFAIGFCVVDFVLCAFIWWLNQQARRKTLEPLRDAMQRTYEGLSALDSESGGADRDLLAILANPALDAKRRRFVRFIRPAWHQVVVMAFTCLGGFFAGMLIQQFSGEPMRYEEWPSLGLTIAAAFAFGSACVRWIGKGD